MSVNLCVNLLHFSTCLHMFFCPFYTITVNKCTYLKNLLLVALFSIVYFARTRTLIATRRLLADGGVDGNCRMNKNKLLVLFGRRRFDLYYRISVVVCWS